MHICIRSNWIRKNIHNGKIRVETINFEDCNTLELENFIVSTFVIFLEWTKRSNREESRS